MTKMINKCDKHGRIMLHDSLCHDCRNEAVSKEEKLIGEATKRYEDLIASLWDVRSGDGKFEYHNACCGCNDTDELGKIKTFIASELKNFYKEITKIK